MRTLPYITTLLCLLLIGCDQVKSASSKWFGVIDSQSKIMPAIELLGTRGHYDARVYLATKEQNKFDKALARETEVVDQSSNYLHCKVKGAGSEFQIYLTFSDNQDEDGDYFSGEVGYEENGPTDSYLFHKQPQ